MNTFLKVVLTCALVNTLACQVKTSGGSDAPAPGPQAGPAPASEKITEQSLQGQVAADNGWHFGSAVGTMTPNGDLQISVSGSGEDFTCDDQHFSKPGLATVVPRRVGEYTFNVMSPNSNAVTMIFAPNASHSDYVNVVGDVSNVTIYSITDEKVEAGIFAASNDPTYPYKINGKFTFYICR